MLGRAGCRKCHLDSNKKLSKCLAEYDSWPDMAKCSSARQDKQVILVLINYARQTSLHNGHN